MLPFGVTIPATVKQRSEIPEGLMNYPVHFCWKVNFLTTWVYAGSWRQTLFRAFRRVRITAKSNYYRRRVCLPVCQSFLPSARNNSAPTKRIFLKFEICVSVKKIQVLLKLDKKAGTLHEGQCTYLIISRSVLLRMGNVSRKSCKKNQKTYHVRNFSRKLCRWWESVKKYCPAGQATDNNMAHAHCVLDN
jgi:hypothetical protein